MSLLVLNAVTKSITAVMSGAAATTNPDFTSHYADADDSVFTEGSNDGVFDGTTPVTLVAAPAASARRIIREITVYNADTAAVTITVNFVSTGGTRKMFSFTLAVGGTWKLSESEDAIAAATTSLAGAVELATTAEVTAMSSSTTAVTPASLKGIVYKVRGLVSNPQAVYAQRAQIVMFRAEADLTITRIHIRGAVTGNEIAGDLKKADDVIIGGFANAAVLDVCDTTSGVFTATSGFDIATVASGQWVYFQFDSSPDAAVKDFYIEVYYTLD
jgi:hypothetical protein